MKEDRKDTCGTVKYGAAAMKAARASVDRALDCARRLVIKNERDRVVVTIEKGATPKSTRPFARRVAADLLLAAGRMLS